MTIEDKLKQMGLELPPPPKPAGLYVPAVRTGNLVFTAGQLPIKGGLLLATGKVPEQVDLERAAQAARQCCLNALAAVKSQAGALENIGRVVRMNVFVSSTPGFFEQAKVANGASELLGELLGPAGQHTRCAVGVAELPLNAPVELDLVVELKSGS